MVTATIEMQDGGKMVFELYPDIAPYTVGNFTDLANLGFYNGLHICRVVKGYLIQGGSSCNDYRGFDEFLCFGEFPNPIQHKRGVISMAKDYAPNLNSVGTEFFILHGDAPQLDGNNPAFGRLIEGWEVLDRLADVQTNEIAVPLVAQVIKSVWVDTEGKHFPIPVRKWLRPDQRDPV